MSDTNKWVPSTPPDEVQQLNRDYSLDRVKEAAHEAELQDLNRSKEALIQELVAQNQIELLTMLPRHRMQFAEHRARIATLERQIQTVLSDRPGPGDGEQRSNDAIPIPIWDGDPLNLEAWIKMVELAIKLLFWTEELTFLKAGASSDLMNIAVVASEHNYCSMAETLTWSALKPNLFTSADPEEALRRLRAQIKERIRFSLQSGHSIICLCKSSLLRLQSPHRPSRDNNYPAVGHP